jgi:2-polyprenyl-3-methyl-5-hydroxy-6-metoxy-1,4-benzoquinol methylase
MNDFGFMDINSAVKTVRRLTQPGYDRAYFDTHEPRYRRAVQRITEIALRDSYVLDLGSHYLHLAAILRFIGYDVVAVDVPAFQSLQFVQARAEMLRIRTIATESAATGDFLHDYDDRFDVVLFCEMLEHIPFNPCDFWRRIHRLLKIGGSVYLSTPNSLQALSALSAIKRIVVLDGIGLNISSIFGNVTYGHIGRSIRSGKYWNIFACCLPIFT